MLCVINKIRSLRRGQYAVFFNERALVEINHFNDITKPTSKCIASNTGMKKTYKEDTIIAVNGQTKKVKSS